jgi:hypothetical protein
MEAQLEQLLLQPVMLALKYQTVETKDFFDDESKSCPLIFNFDVNFCLRCCSGCGFDKI